MYNIYVLLALATLVSTALSFYYFEEQETKKIFKELDNFNVKDLFEDFYIPTWIPRLAIESIEEEDEDYNFEEVVD